MVSEYLWHMIRDVGIASMVIVHPSPSIRCYDQSLMSAGKSRTVNLKKIKRVKLDVLINFEIPAATGIF